MNLITIGNGVYSVRSVIRNLRRRTLIAGLFRVGERVVATLRWLRRGYSSPSPGFVKQNVLLRNGVPGATWIETGTYLGDTTLFLSRHAEKVISIEPDIELWRQAKSRLRKFQNIDLVNGTSEEVFESVLAKVSGNVNFWLDGHYSGGVTYHSGNVTPIEEELAVIERRLDQFDEVSILVDDVRLFDPAINEYEGYPSIDTLVQWAQSREMRWKIEHDIFIATNVGH